MPQSFTYTTHVDRFGNESGTYFIRVPQEVYEGLDGKVPIRILATVNQNAPHYCAVLAYQDTHYFMLNKRVVKEWEIETGDTVEVKIEPDTSKYGMPMPEELEELLAIDDEGQKRFDALKPGRQRNIIHLVSKPKNVDTRIQKAITIVDNLKLGITDLKGLTKSRR